MPPTLALLIRDPPQNLDGGSRRGIILDAAFLKRRGLEIQQA